MRTIRWGVLGTANIARTVVAAIGRSQWGLAKAVASRDGERARSWAEEMAVENAFGTYEALLACKEIDAVYVPLPNALHGAWTIRALEAGLPVLCEKPFAMDRAEAERVAVVARRLRLPVAEAFMYRFHPMFGIVRDLLDAGAIGELVSIDSRFSFFEDDRTGIVASARLGGGALMDVGCYCVNFSRMIAQAEPVSVSAMQVGQGIDDTMVGMMAFPGGLLARFEASIASAERHGAEVLGTTGAILLPSPWVPGDQEVTVLVKRWGQPDEKILVPGADTYRMEVDDFARAVNTGADPRWPVADAVANMATLDALFESARTGRQVCPGG